jgi:peptidoglycan/LPS O-acetylase OafA/YrhL
MYGASPTTNYQHPLKEQPMDLSNDLSISNSVSSTPVPRLRLEFLDGLRGLMALYVVLFHAAYFTQALPLHPVVAMFTSWLHLGHYAVDVFIVLSGYCLMMPIARAGSDTLLRGMGEYIYRRAKRILPPYYMALIFSFVLVMVGQFLQRSGGVEGNQINDVFTPGIILSHLFLVHNLDFVWAHRINAPMWSVATEWQIYFLFPLLLLPLRRRVGNIVTIVVALALGLIPWFVLPTDSNFYWASPWFLGLFAMGMFAADVTLRQGAFKPRWHRWLAAWPTFVIAFALVVAPILPADTELWIYDVLVGIGTISLIMYCVRLKLRDQTSAGWSPLLRLFESRLAVWLGAFSYSLYLIHNPLQQASLRFLQTHLPSTELILGFQILISLTLIIGAAYCFHLMFERPFMNMPPAKINKQPSTTHLIVEDPAAVQRATH